MIKRALITFSTLAAFISLYMFYEMYLKWNFSNEGRAFDPVEGVVYQEHSYIWAIAAFILFLPALKLIFTKKKGP